MYKFLFYLLFFIAFLPEIKAQSDSSKTILYSDEEVIGTKFITKDAAFPGGNDSMRVFIKKNLRIPKEVKEKDLTPKSFVTIIVETDGSITEILNAKSTSNCKECDLAAIEVVKKMPKWLPAEYNGKPVRSRMMIPIKFY